ncbi:MAG: iron uptake porin, partial [Waterburya sp.]
MSKFWVKTNEALSIITFCLFFTLSAEASIISKPKNINLNWQNKINFKNAKRQEDLIRNFETKIDRNKTLITQTNRVEQLQDIKPTDWSYQALKNLIERYDCIDGFPKRTAQAAQAGGETLSDMFSQSYRGEQNVSRAEFAAGLNACFNKIENIIANSENVPQGDVDKLLRLMQEFQSDLAILQGRIDGSQAYLQDLEVTQFSTTSKLTGEAIFGLSSILSGNDPDSTIFGSRLRLDLQTSFNGEDLLFTRLSRSDFPGFESEIGTFQGNLSFADPDDDDDFRLDALYYSFRIGDRLDFILGAAGLAGDDIAPTINFLDGDGGSGSISAFGTRNPLYYPPGDAGLGVTHSPIEQIKISAGYLASPANEPNSGSGLFNGP